MGGGTAIELAMETPQRVAALVLAGADSPGFVPTEKYESPEWPEAVAAFEAGDLARVAQLDASMWLAGRERSVADVDPDLVKLFIEMDLLALENEEIRDDLRQPGPDLAGAISSLSMRTLALVGEYDLPPLIESAHDLAGKLSHTGAVVVRDAAHLPSLQNPAAFSEALAGFLGGL
jgi:pimeloyl-ACP methyl ester carboxylesterase